MRGCAIFAAALLACSWASAGADPADKAFAAVETALPASQPGWKSSALNVTLPLEQLLLMKDRMKQAFQVRAAQFLDAYPQDSRRLQVIRWLLRTDLQPDFIKQIGPMAPGSSMAVNLCRSATYDDAAYAAWQARLSRLRHELKVAMDGREAWDDSQPAARAFAAVESVWLARQGGSVHAEGSACDEIGVLVGTERRAQSLRLEGLKFLAAWPEDPRRWQVIAWLDEDRPVFIRDIKSLEPAGDWQAAWNSIVRDEAAAAAWGGKLEQLDVELKAAANILPSMREAYVSTAYFDVHAKAYDALETGDEIDLAALRTRLQAYIGETTNPDQAALYLASYLALLSQRDMEKAEENARLYARHPDTALRAAAQSQLKLIAEQRNGRPVALSFTALDGRKVDLGKLRGKVVLLEFWAT